jgi:transcriptional regulator with XRE-family HTH domain
VIATKFGFNLDSGMAGGVDSRPQTIRSSVGRSLQASGSIARLKSMAARKQPAPSHERSFDAEGFYDALDAERQSRGITWKEIARESGVSASTLTRMGQGRRPDVDSLAALSAWANLDADRFIRGRRKKEAKPLAMISTYLRSDPNLSPDSARLLESIVKTTYEKLRDR